MIVSSNEVTHQNTPSICCASTTTSGTFYKPLWPTGHKVYSPAKVQMRETFSGSPAVDQDLVLLLRSTPFPSSFSFTGRWRKTMEKLPHCVSISQETTRVLMNSWGLGLQGGCCCYRCCCFLVDIFKSSVGSTCALVTTGSSSSRTIHYWADWERQHVNIQLNQIKFNPVRVRLVASGGR